MDQTYQEVIQQTATELIGKMGFPAVKISVERVGEKAFLCNIDVEQDQNLLIGQYGVNLAAVQHLIRVVSRKKIQEPLSISVDINGYFAGKKSLLEQEARRAAEEAARSGAPVTLRPMLSHERKVVHSFLAGEAGIVTESIGRGDERRIVVQPKGGENGAPSLE